MIWEIFFNPQIKSRARIISKIIASVVWYCSLVKRNILQVFNYFGFFGRIFFAYAIIERNLSCQICGVFWQFSNPQMYKSMIAGVKHLSYKLDFNSNFFELVPEKSKKNG